MRSFSGITKMIISRLPRCLKTATDSAIPKEYCLWLSLGHAGSLAEFTGLNYTVELTDASGNVVSVENPVLVYHSLAIQFSRQDAMFGTYEYKHQLQQVTIDPSVFAASGFDFSNVVSMKISIKGAEEGELIINNIGYWN